LSDDSIFEFPCRFPLKVMGRNDPAFEQYVTEIVRIHAGSPALGAVTTRPSRNGRYLAVTIVFTASSRAQLDDIYRAMSASEQVLFLL
jgi:uncharacterized protein